MENLEVNFIGSFPRESACPNGKLPEYAFIGRSNVGKSSLINMICERKSLARVSKKPGKTQLINYFQIEKRWYLVDLPGYGYAKLSKKHRQSLRIMIEGYLSDRRQLSCAFVLIDANVPPQSIDIEFINWMGSQQIPFAIIFTKSDRLSPNKLDSNVALFKKTMSQYWTNMPPYFITSSVLNTGRDEILSFIMEVNEQVEIGYNKH